MVDLRKIVAVIVVGAASLLLMVQYITLVKPAAAREVDAACRGMRTADKSKTLAKFPMVAPEFKARDYAGKEISLSDYRGKVVLVNFWASWCGTCEMEKPALIRFQEEMASDDLVVLALASDRGWQPIRDKYPQGIPLTVLLDTLQGDETYGPIAKAYGITAVPESFIVDKQGIIRYYFINKRDWDSDIARTCLRALTDE